MGARLVEQAFLQSTVLGPLPRSNPASSRVLASRVLSSLATLSMPADLIAPQTYSGCQCCGEEAAEQVPEGSTWLQWCQDAAPPLSRLFCLSCLFDLPPYLSNNNNYTLNL